MEHPPHYPPPPPSPSARSSSSSESMADDTTPEERPFACTYPGCTRSFKRKYTLKDHLNAHTGEKPFVCPVTSCGKSFTTSGNLARHKRLHPWLDTPLQCLVDGCGCEFPNDEKLRRHMQSHFDDSGDCRCEIGTCGRVFTTVGNLRRHIKQNHGEELNGDRVQASPALRAQPSQAIVSPVSPGVTVALEATPGPQGFPPPSDHRLPRLPTDNELLDALSCLFDDNDNDGSNEHMDFYCQRR